MAYTDIIKRAKAAGEISSSCMRQLRRRAFLKWPKIDPRFLRYFVAAHGIALLTIGLLFTGSAAFAMLFAIGTDPAGESSVFDQGAQFWVFFSVILCSQFVISFLFLGRLSGNMVPFKRALSILIQGEIPAQIRVRRDDFLQAEARLANEAIAVLTQRDQDEKSKRKKLMNLAAALRTKGMEEEARRVEEILGEHSSLSHREEPCAPVHLN